MKTTRIALAALAVFTLTTGLATAGKFNDTVFPDASTGGKRPTMDGVFHIPSPKVDPGDKFDPVNDRLTLPGKIDPDHVQYFDYDADELKVLTASGVLDIDCDITSPTRLSLVNHGTIDIPAGVSVAWTIPEAELKGVVVLKTELRAGSRLSLKNIGSGLDRDDACTAAPKA